ncbi:hypothetical protein [Jiangella alkaliphila]|uniref:hypothetical protein n=1 Tax=Jiangella alkaliphila TaxID=419479 RepID=UPI001364BFC4|nr:hypothetical protein [Jiangella alkaliphila]
MTAAVMLMWPSGHASGAVSLVHPMTVASAISPLLGSAVNLGRGGSSEASAAPNGPATTNAITSISAAATANIHRVPGRATVVVVLIERLLNP